MVTHLNDIWSSITARFLGSATLSLSPDTRSVRRIDVHHHFFPSSLNKVRTNEQVGWKTPEENLPWTPGISLQFLDESGIDVAILSFPALSSGVVGVENRAAAREHNLALAHICRSYPERFGFFATLPFLNDVQGAIAEIAYALDELKADGIALSSSYGQGEDSKYVGHDDYIPLWEELNRRRAVVFLHGAQTPSSTPYPHAFLGIPISEVPNETFKAAAHLVVTGKKRDYPNIKIILAHLGGSTPFLAARVAVLSKHMGCTLTSEEILADFRSFYYETALSAYESNLVAMQSFVSSDRILFGTDFPAVDAEMVDWYTKNLESFHACDDQKLRGVMYENALRLFPRLRIT